MVARVTGHCQQNPELVLSLLRRSAFKVSIFKYLSFILSSFFTLFVVFFCLLSSCILELSDSSRILRAVTFIQETVVKLVHNEMEASRPIPSFNADERIIHQRMFKDKLIKRYMGSGELRCMVTGALLKRKKLIAAQIIGINQRRMLAKVNLLHEDLWNERNGILVCEALVSAYSKLEVVSLSTYATHLF
jgi:hypothetical protein